MTSRTSSTGGGGGGGGKRITPDQIGVIIAGWSNDQADCAREVAKACRKRGYQMIPLGLAANDVKENRLEIPDIGQVEMIRSGDQNMRNRLQQEVQNAQKQGLFPVVVDTSCTPSNVQVYNELKVPFVLETKPGEQLNYAIRDTEAARNVSLITDVMNKRLAAIDSMMEDWSRRFPGLFGDFDFFFKSSKPEETSKRLLGSFSDLINRDFGMDQIQPFKQGEEKNLGFTEGHVSREFSFKNGTGTSMFTFRQSVNDQREYADSMADSVAFLAQKANEIARPQVYSILDVAQQSRFLTW